MPKLKDFVSPIKKGKDFTLPKTVKGEKNIKAQYTPGVHKLSGDTSRLESIMRGGQSSDDADTAKKLARIAAIKKAALANKKYNVGTSTAADPGASPALSSLLGYGGGGGGGYYEGTSGGGGFSLSDIPSIVWIVLAVGAGYWLIKSGGKGKKLF